MWVGCASMQPGTWQEDTVRGQAQPAGSQQRGDKDRDNHGDLWEGTGRAAQSQPAAHTELTPSRVTASSSQGLQGGLDVPPPNSPFPWAAGVQQEGRWQLWGQLCPLCPCPT